jgi:large subunit ribosomal protein L10
VLIASQLQDTFNGHGMVAVYHYNGLSTHEWNEIRFKLSRNGIRVKIFPSKLSMKILQGSRYVHISPLFRGATAVAFSKEPAAIKELLSVTNTESKLHLLGGVVEDVMMTPLGLQNYADLPSLKDMQQILLGTLNQTQMMLARSLQGTSQKLSHLLSQIASDSTSETAQ